MNEKTLKKLTKNQHRVINIYQKTNDTNKTNNNKHINEGNDNININDKNENVKKIFNIYQDTNNIINNVTFDYIQHGVLLPNFSE